MHRPTIQRLAAALAISVLASTSTSAANFCVSSATQLEAAIDAARSNYEDDVIKIHIGQYDLPDGLTYYGQLAETGSLYISGGWLSFPSACATQFPEAGLTVLNGMGTGLGLAIRVQSPSHGIVSIGNLSILDTLSSSGGAGGLSLNVPTAAPQPLSADIYNLRVQHCENHLTAGCGISARGPAHIRLRNVLVGDTQSDDSNAGGGVLVRQNASGSLQLQHATIAGNSTLNNGRGGLYVETDIPVVVENSIFYGNPYSGSVAAADCDLVLRSNTTVRHSIVDRLCGTPTPGQLVSVVDIDPGFVGADYRFGPGSPALDAGLAVTTIPSIPKDLAGNDRVQGGLPDLGAYEGAVLPDLMLVDGFE